MHSIKQSLDKISSCFCSAKWLQVTLRLQNGHTHSCHHPKTHKISTTEILNNPSALHNTKTKKLARKEMLEGVRPKECSYCWKVEDLPGSQISDRLYKSNDPWAKPYLQDIANLPWDANVIPRYLEVSFSNVCNFKCAYCFPDVSTKWMSEVLEFGPYPTTDFFGSLLYLKKEGTTPRPEKNNPYISSFWKWLPEIFTSLHVLRITGGEPFLSKDTFRVLDYVKVNPNPKLDLSLNTNLGLPTNLVKKVINQLSELRSENKISEAHIFTSLDTWGEQAEYIRFGLDLNLWKQNLNICLSNPNIQTSIMVTFNALSVFQFKDFLQFILNTKIENKINRAVLDISILHNPLFLSLLILEKQHLLLIDDCLEFMIQNSSEKIEYGFNNYEISKMQRLVEYSKTELPKNEIKKRRINFISYIKEYDRRKKTNFNKIFPEMNSVFNTWSSLKNKNPFYEKISLSFMCYIQKLIGRKLMKDNLEQT